MRLELKSWAFSLTFEDSLDAYDTGFFDQSFEVGAEVFLAMKRWSNPSSSLSSAYF